MTTMSIQDELAKLGSVTAADIKKEAVAQSVYRPDTRPAVISGHGRVQITGRINKEGTRQDGSTWTSKALGIRFSNLSNVKVYRNRQPFTESSFDYEIPLPEDESKVSPSSQLGKTIEALGESRSILDIADVECDFEEMVVPPPTDKDGNVRLDRDGYKMKPTFYYRFYNLSGATAHINASTATVEGEEIACAVAAGKTDAELTPNNFLTAFSAAGGTDPVVQAEIAGRKFLPRMVGEGKLNKLEDGAYALN